jgi:hypothetical protein
VVSAGGTTGKRCCTGMTLSARSAVSGSTTAIVVRLGLHAIELSFQAHPDVPAGGDCGRASRRADVHHAGARGQTSRIAAALAGANFQ